MVLLVVLLVMASPASWLLLHRLALDRCFLFLFFLEGERWEGKVLSVDVQILRVMSREFLVMVAFVEASPLLGVAFLRWLLVLFFVFTCVRQRGVFSFVECVHYTTALFRLCSAVRGP